MKKIVACLLVLTMILGIVPAFAEGENEPPMTYSVILNGSNDEYNTIKAICEMFGYNLLVAKGYVETAPHTIAQGLNIEGATALKAKLDGAGAITEIAGKFTGSEAAEDQRNNYTVVLTGCIDKPAAIKILRQMFGWDLATAKHFTDTLPRTLGEGMTYKAASDLVNTFAQAGANAIMR